MAGMIGQDDEHMGEKHARKSPVLRLKLSVTENEEHPPQEVVRRVTKAHEVVEVDGFLFKRKRRVPLGESANVLASAKKAKTQQKVVDGQIVEEEDSVQAGPKRAADNMHSLLGAGEGLETSDRGIQGSPQAMPNEAAEAAVQPSEIDVVEAAHAALASLPAECATESDRLLALCEKLVEDEVRSAEGQPGAELLQKALGTFLDDIRASLGNGTLQCSEQAVTASAGLERQQKLRAELETQKAVLTARLERFLEEEAEWNELLQGGSAEEGNAGADRAPAAAPPEAGAPAAEAGGAAEAALILGGDLPLVQEGASSDATAAPDQPESAEPVVGVLQQAHADTHRTLTMQVEGLCAMVEGVRELVETAEHITSTEFDKLYKEKFSALPGLNSPARLIREIVRPPRSRLHGASSAAPGAVETSPATPV
ncbi:hypothetical protein WJX75_000230 [Coccomyxa subellipsoidea]|uniref:Uncharacterized protein n=1 Tax=Coccomyxa subellipsoidea TaxID=248742 RepID=A0ABR2YK66_9CHLO